MISIDAVNASVDGSGVEAIQFEAAVSYIVESLLANVYLLGFGSTRHANAKIAKSNDSHERCVILRLWQKAT